MIDEADEFGNSIERAAISALRYLFMQADRYGMPRGSGGTTFMERAKEKLEDWRARLDQEEAIERALESEEELDAEDAEAHRENVARGSKDQTVAFVDDIKDLEFLSNELRRANVEFSLDKSQARTKGIWGVVVPETPTGLAVHLPLSKVEHPLRKEGGPISLSEASEEIRELLAYFSADALASKLALRECAGEMAPKLTATTSVKFDPASPNNLFLDFRTVEWDRNADIIADPLERMGVPFDKTEINEGIQRFSFHPESASDVMRVVDFHLNNPASKIVPSRFPNLEEVRRAAAAPNGMESNASPHGMKDAPVRDEILSVTVPDPREAQALQSALDEQGIAFESFASKTTGAQRFVVSAAELNAKRGRMDAAIESARDAGARTDVRSQAKDKSRAKSKATKNKAFSTADRGFYVGREHTPTIDERAAVKSANARNRDNQKKSRSQKRAR